MILAAGTIVQGAYEIIALLGQGGMGAVYKARQLGIGRLVAIKFLDFASNDEESLERFRREALVLSKISHKNLPAFFSFGFWEENVPFIVMEYLEGRTLKSLVAESSNVEWHYALGLTKQICQGMNYVHSCGVIHRDLKPENIFLVIESSDAALETVKIYDFGLAKIFERTESERKLETLTKTGFLLGTTTYMSPEQCMGAKVDLRCDVYSIGCILFEMLTGSPPYTADTPVGVIFQHTNQEIPQLPKELPVGLDPIMQKALAKKADDRYQNTIEFARDLDRVLEGQQSSKVWVSDLPKTARKLGPMLLSLVAIASIATFTFIISRDRGETSRKVSEQRQARNAAGKQLLETAIALYRSGQGEIAVRKLEAEIGNRGRLQESDNLSTAQLRVASANFHFKTKGLNKLSIDNTRAALNYLEKNNSDRSRELKALSLSFSASMLDHQKDGERIKTLLSQTDSLIKEKPLRNQTERMQVFLNLGEVYSRLSQKARAEECYTEVLKEAEPAPQTAIVAIIDTAPELGISEDAETLYLSALLGLAKIYRGERWDKIVELLEGPLTNQFADSQRNELAALNYYLAAGLFAQRKYGEAQPFFDRAMQIYKSHTIDQAEFAPTIIRSAINLLHLGKITAARELIDAYTESIQKSSASESQDLTALITFAETCRELGFDQDAIRYSEAALKTMTDNNVENYALSRRCFKLIFDVEEKRKASIPKLALILERWQKCASELSPGREEADQLAGLGNLYLHTGEPYQTSKKYYAKALRIAVKACGETDPLTHYCYLWLARTSLTCGDFKTALSSALGALEGRLKNPQMAGHKEGLAEDYVVLAYAYKENQKIDLAEKTFEKALSILDPLLADPKSRKREHFNTYEPCVNGLIEIMQSKNQKIEDIKALQAKLQAARPR